MRLSGIALGQTAAYPGPLPVTLLDGTNIKDPGNTPASAAQCLPYQCGEDASNSGAIFWCAYWGQADARSCMDPACADYQNACVFRAPASQAQMNAQVSRPVAQAAAKANIPARLTPANIVQAMPDITLALQPVQTQSCSAWDEVNGWIANSPLLAAAILAGVFVIAWRHNGR